MPHPADPSPPATGGWAASALNRLTVLQKLLVLSASFLLPILVLTAYTLAGIQAEIRFADTERVGARYLAALGELMRQVALYPGESPERWTQRTAEAWRTLEGVDRQAAAGGGGALPGLGPLRARWSQAGLDAPPDAARRAAAARPEVVAATEAAIVAVGDAMNLALDPDLDTTALIEMAVRDLPHLQAQLATLLSDPELGEGRRRLDFAEQARLVAWSALLRDAGERVAANAAKAVAANARSSRVSPTLPDALRGAVQTFAIELEVLVLLLVESARPDAPPEGRTALGWFGARVSEEGFAAWSTALTELERLLDARRAAQERQRRQAILAVLATLAVSAGLVLSIIRNITRPLDLLVAAARRIATGDLTGRPALGRRDEIGVLGAAMSGMAQSLASLVGKVQGASVQMAATATELASASRQQESLVADLGGSTGRAAAAVSQISASSQELARAMRRVQAGTGDSERLADAGRAGLAEMEETMRRLLAATQAVSAGLAAIRDQANAVGAVVTTMTTVADQTNLLSLNASIEAERLGEQGRGVAVVAREVRRLADQTAVATLDIERMVDGMRGSVSAGGQEVQALAAEMQRGGQASAAIGRRLAQIIGRIQELAPQFDAVAAGVQAQSQGAGEISGAMAALDLGARQATESLRQFNAAASRMRQAAQALRAEVEGFRV